MGDFAVNCAMSHVSILEGDRVKLIPLQGLSTGTQCVMIDDNFVPLTLPIEGTYNGYGGIVDIKEDKNTKIIEQYFGLPIQNFCNIVCDYGFNVYESNDAKQIRTENVNEMVPEEICRKLGYKESGFGVSSTIFSTPYGELTIYGDNNLSLSLNKEYKDKIDIESILKLEPNNMAKRILRLHDTLTGEMAFVSSKEKVTILNNTHPMFVLDQIYTEFSTKDNVNTSENILKEQIRDAIRKNNHLAAIFQKNGASMEMDWLRVSLENISYLYIFTESKAISTLYASILEDENAIENDTLLLKMFVEFYNFVRKMYATNTMFSPSFQGTQYGSLEDEIHLHYLAHKFLLDRQEKKNNIY